MIHTRIKPHWYVVLWNDNTGRSYATGQLDENFAIERTRIATEAKKFTTQCKAETFAKHHRGREEWKAMEFIVL